jgi:hypothetical protein
MKVNEFKFIPNAPFIIRAGMADQQFQNSIFLVNDLFDISKNFNTSFGNSFAVLQRDDVSQI